MPGHPGLAGTDRRRLPASSGHFSGRARIAPKSGSAFIQATAQEGRAWARLGDARQTRATLNRVEALVSPLPVPDRPEHHYRYDPPKAQFYVATTLSWLGDTAAEGIARQVLAAIEAPELRPRPRRAALARLDLALALTAADKHDEAAGVALEAVTSGRLAPVDGRRAREIVLAVAERRARSRRAGRSVSGDLRRTRPSGTILTSRRPTYIPVQATHPFMAHQPRPWVIRRLFPDWPGRQADRGNGFIRDPRRAVSRALIWRK